MGEILLPNAYQRRLLSTLAPRERCFAESLFRAAPNRSHGPAGSPKLDRRPMRSPAAAAINAA